MKKHYSVEILPHKDPFLFVDQVEEINFEQRSIICSKPFLPEESFFQGHFPGYKIVPGVILTEAIAQSVALLFLHGDFFL